LAYATDLGASGTIDWSLDGNFNESVITKAAATPALLAGQQLYDLTAKSNLTSSSPKEKVSLGAVWALGGFSLSLRETIYGPSWEWNSPDGGAYYKNEVKTAAITDIEASYSFTDYLKLTFGANNLFDKNPETIGLTPSGDLTTGNTALYDNPNPYSPYGTNGGYYYVKVSTKF
jgi:iron complex outermembrane receptor protein